MPLRPDIIEKRAIKAGVKASKKRHHLVTEKELLALKVQVMPGLPRILLVVTGLLLILSCFISWPADDTVVRSIEAISGVFLLLFGAFGIRRTLDQVLDASCAIDAAGSIIEAIANAIPDIDL